MDDSTEQRRSNEDAGPGDPRPVQTRNGPRHLSSRTPRHRAPRPDPKLKILRPLGINDFALLWTGLFVSLVGDGVFIVALPLQVFELRDTATAFTIALIAWTVPLVLCLPLAGVLSDRFERRRMMIIAVTMQGVAVAGMGLLAVTNSIDLWHIYLLAAVYGTGEGLFGPAFGSIVPDIVPKELLVAANSLDNFSRPFAQRLVGPALGGIIVTLSDPGGAFLVDAGSFGAAALVFTIIRTRGKSVEERRRGPMWQEMKEGFEFVRNNAWLLGGLGSAALGLLIFYGPWQALVPYRVTHALSGDGLDLAMLYAAGGAGAVLASMLISQRDMPKRFMTAMYLAMAIGTLMLVGYGAATRVWHVVVASFVMHALFAAGIIIWQTTMHKVVPGAILGRVSSLDWFVSTSLIPVSLAIAGPLSNALGPGRVLIGAGVLGCAALLSFLLLPGVRDPELEKFSEPALSHD